MIKEQVKEIQSKMVREHFERIKNRMKEQGFYIYDDVLMKQAKSSIKTNNSLIKNSNRLILGL